MIEASLSEFFSQWRRVVLGGNRVVLEGLVNADPEAEPPPRLRHALAQWPGHYYWQRRSDGRWLVLVREFVAARERWWLHALLLVATFLTASLAGAALLPAGGAGGAGGLAGAEIGETLLDRLIRGLPFSAPLLAILGAHEVGHYLMARRYRVNASPPFFLPFVPELNLIGTLGAFIRLRSPVYDRQTLFDIGAAGPLAGVAIAVPVLAFGLAQSHVSTDVPATMLAHQVVVLNGLPPWHLGDSLLMLILRELLAPQGAQGVLELHPAAVAGWVGLFVTMLNLFPLAQFDGGHVLFALLGRRQLWAAWAFWALLVVMGLRLWPGWLVWAILAQVVGRGSLAHPRIVAAVTPLDPRRQLVGWLLFAIFVLCFIPQPIA